MHMKAWYTQRKNKLNHVKEEYSKLIYIYEFHQSENFSKEKNLHFFLQMNRIDVRM